jgi:hypothetical protein
MTRTIWVELFDGPWPGSDEAAITAMAAEIRALRLLSDTIVTTALDDMNAHRDFDEIQRAHDLVGQYCVEMEDDETFKFVSALCWVLRHDHNNQFAKVLAMVESRMEYMGFHVIKLPDLRKPGDGDK